MTGVQTCALPICIHGLNVYYLPRTHRDLDDVLNEDTLSEYTQALLIEMYVKNVDSFEGEGDFLSKFGLQIRDSMTMTVAHWVSLRIFTNLCCRSPTLTNNSIQMLRLTLTNHNHPPLKPTRLRLTRTLPLLVVQRDAT